jgi:biopolymer transport protein ExbD
MKRKDSKPVDDPGIDLSPLIDLSFLLLIYFLATSTLEPIESDLAMTLPEPTGGKAPTIDLMEVEVNGAGHILANGEVLDIDTDSRELPLLLDRLKTYAASARLTETEPVVIVAADDGAKGQRFVDVLNALAHREVGIENITLAGFVQE